MRKQTKAEEDFMCCVWWVSMVLIFGYYTIKYLLMPGPGNKIGGIVIGLVFYILIKLGISATCQMLKDQAEDEKKEKGRK